MFHKNPKRRERNDYIPNHTTYEKKSKKSGIHYENVFLFDNRISSFENSVNKEITLELIGVFITVLLWFFLPDHREKQSHTQPNKWNEIRHTFFGSKLRAIDGIVNLLFAAKKSLLFDFKCSLIKHKGICWFFRWEMLSFEFVTWAARWLIYEDLMGSSFSVFI